MPADTPFILTDIRRKVLAGGWPHAEAVEETGSTNSDLRAYAQAAGPDGREAFLVALRQTAGRGTHGREWESVAGGLYMSALFRCPLPAEKTPWLGIAATVSMANAIRSLTSLAPSVKWPNDVLVEGRKVGGTLVEHWPASGADPDTVAGLGLNVNLSSADLAPEIRSHAAGLRDFIPANIDLAAMAGRIAGELRRQLALLSRDGGRSLRDQFHACLAWRGEEVCVVLSGGSVEGRLLGVDEEANPVVKTDREDVRCQRGTIRQLRRAGALALLFCIAFFHSPESRADVLYLKNGGRLEGRIQRTEETYIVKSGSAVFKVPEEDVRHFEAKPLPEEEYARRLAHTPEDDADAQYVLGLWCRQQNMTERAEAHFEQAVAADPEHALARREAGYRKVSGKWVTREEEMEAKGLASYNGRWLKKEHAERLRARDRRKARSRKLFYEAWEIYRRIRRNPDHAEPDVEAGRLLDLGDGMLIHLRRGATESCAAIRETALTALGSSRERGAAGVLAYRLTHEPSQRLRILCAEMLRAHPHREEALRSLVDRLFTYEDEYDRDLIIYGLSVIGDARAIPMLIPRAGYNPNNAGSAENQTPAGKHPPAEANEAPLDSKENTDRPAEETPGDNPLARFGLEKMRASGAIKIPDEALLKPDEVPTLAEKLGHGRRNLSAPYYPAAEALKALTGRVLGHDPDAWAAWWESARDGFVMPAPLPLPERRQRTVESKLLQTGSLRDQMLRRYR